MLARAVMSAAVKKPAIKKIGELQTPSAMSFSKWAWCSKTPLKAPTGISKSINHLFSLKILFKAIHKNFDSICGSMSNLQMCK